MNFASQSKYETKDTYAPLATTILMHAGDSLFAIHLALSLLEAGICFEFDNTALE